MHWLVLAASTPEFFTELTLLLVSSAAIAYLCFRLGLVPVVGFLATGIIIGPHALGLVRDPALTEAAAEIGIVLLLFTIGLEFNLQRLARIRRVIGVGGSLQVGFTILLTTVALVSFGVDLRAAVFTGALVSLSSTAIVMKLLSDRAATQTSEGQATVGILIFQDLAIVAMVLLVPFLAGTGGSAAGAAWALVQAVAIVVFVVVLARRAMPRVLDAVARTCSQELFLLVVVAIAIGTAWLTSLAGVSLGLGAFLAGLLVSESSFREHAAGEVLPLRILFTAAFFVSVGLLLDLSFLWRNLGLIAAIVLGAFVIKVIATGAAFVTLRAGAATGGFAALILAQVGEFSFVLERAGRDAGLYAFGMTETGSQLFIATTVILMAFTPLQASLGRRWYERARARAGGDRPTVPTAVPLAEQCEGLKDHTLIAGYGSKGRAVARALHEAARPFVVLTLGPDGAREADGDGYRVLRADYAREHTLRKAGIEHAVQLVVADDDLERAQHVVSVTRMLRPDILIHAYAHDARRAEELRLAGADRVVAGDDVSAAALVESALSKHLPGAGDMVRLTPEQLAQGCIHAKEAAAAVPRTEGCESCLATGGRWVHLRLCMTCGRVGCCDSSPGKHASAHFYETGHPLIRSFEPGESWAWCYVDEAAF